MGVFDIDKVCYPIVGLYDREKGKYDIRDIYGTAFSIMNGYFLTAAHCIVNAKQNEKYGIAYLPENSDEYDYSLTESYEIFEDFDIGILQLDIPRTQVFFWNNTQCDNLSNVFSLGFPYG